MFSLTIKIGVRRILEESSRSKVDQFELERLGVDEEVLVLDVPVDHALPVASQHSLDNLEKMLKNFVFQVSKFSRINILWPPQDFWLTWRKKFLARFSSRTLFSVMKSKRSLHGSGLSMTMMKESWRSK